MPKKISCIIIAAVMLLSSCTAIDYDNLPIGTKDENGIIFDETDQTDVETSNDPEPDSLNSEQKITLSETRYAEHSEKVEIELIAERNIYKSLAGHSGEGYIQLSNEDAITIAINVPSTQHYKVTIQICTVECEVTLTTGSGDSASLWGSYKVKSDEFKPYSIDGVYLEKGGNLLTFQAVKGIAYFDFFVVEASKTLLDNPAAFKISGTPSNKNANQKTISTMKFFADTYGKKVITGQHVTPFTNTELNAVYNETGRFPAMRCSDLSQFGLYYDGAKKDPKDEIALIKEFSDKGGLINLSWTWYSPGEKPHYYADLTDFNLDEAINTESKLYETDLETLLKMNENGEIKKGSYDLMADIDNIAAILKTLQEQGVTVLFRPLPEAENGWFWWGTSEKSYRWLYRTIYDRMTSFHKLNNIIWLWNGQKASFFPGDEYVDIISEDVYNATQNSNVDRMIKAQYYTEKSYAVAMSECGKIPDPDLLARDKALWLWFALFKGDYIINSDGSLSAEKINKEELLKAYNHELTLTLDELPDIGNYGVIE